jgi:hypothetical protein
MEIQSKQPSKPESSHQHLRVLPSPSNTYTDSSLIRYRRSLVPSDVLLEDGAGITNIYIGPLLTVNSIKIYESDRLVHEQSFAPTFKLKL